MTSITKIEKYLKKDSFEDFKQKDVIIDAVLNNLLIIGEASSQLQDEIKKKYNNIPWREIIDFRNIAIHKYHSLNLKMVWSIIKEKIPQLKKDVEDILKHTKTNTFSNIENSKEFIDELRKREDLEKNE